MAHVGLKMVTLALVDENQKIITGADDGLSESGIYQVGNQDFGTKTANLTNLEGTATKVPGNNQVQDEYYGPAAPQAAFDMNNLNFEVAQKCLGFKSDGKGGWDKQDAKPRVACMIESESLDRTHSLFWGFGNGTMSAPSENIGTDTDTAQTRTDDNITYSALTTTAYKGKPYKKYNSGDDGFDSLAMMKDTFGGFEGAYPGFETSTPDGAPDTNTTVTGVTVSPSTDSIDVGKTTKLTVTIVPTTATDKSGTWTVDDTSIATIDEDGTVTGVKAGTAKATFTTKDGAKTSSSTITVNAGA